MGADMYSRRERKMELERKCLIRCTFCPFHRWDNSSRTDNRCWKTYRRSQYRHLTACEGLRMLDGKL